MSRKYQEKPKSGREFVDRTIEWNTYTIDRCMRLPAEWKDYLLDPLVKCSNDIEDLVVRSNRVYINREKQEDDEFKKAVRKRDDMLYEALWSFDAFDIKFERLMSYVDISGSEIKRLTHEIYKMCDAYRDSHEDTECMKIKVISHRDTMEYTSANGTVYQSLKLNADNRDHWLFLRSEAEKEIKKRLNGDKRLLKGDSDGKSKNKDKDNNNTESENTAEA